MEGNHDHAADDQAVEDEVEEQIGTVVLFEESKCTLAESHGRVLVLD